MSRFIFWLLLAFAAVPAHAQIVTSQLQGETTCQAVAVSSLTATQVDFSTGTYENSYQSAYLDVQDQDATNAVYCGNSVSVSTYSATGKGFEIAAGTDHSWTLQDSQTFWCRSASDTATVQIVACKTE